MRVLRRRPELGIAAVVGLLLVLTAGRYGYHRDELYFLAAGRHLAWGYPDQPPLAPLLARVMDTLVPGSVVALRVPSALMAAGVVVLAGATARRLGAEAAGVLLAATATGLMGVTLATGHMLSTATLDLFGWVLVGYLLVRLLQGGDRRLWLVAGLVAGVTMLANVLIGFLLAGFAVALLLVGPRRLVLSPWVWAAGALAVLLATPYLLWQAGHGWPQLEVAGSIADGGSGTSASRLTFLPMLVVQIGPFLLPLWVTGLVCLLRDAALRCLGVTFLVLVVVFVATGGKPYYVAGLVPLLLAAGAQPFLDRVRRPWVVPAMLVLSLPVLVITLPLLPVRWAGAVIPVNYDAGETIGWPVQVQQIATAYARMPAGSAIVTGNYGEAGAVDRYGPALGLPRAHSGHNGYGEWGHPPGSAPALVVGIDPTWLAQSCDGLRLLGRLDNGQGIDNDEDGVPLTSCMPRQPWSVLWPRFTRLG